MGYCNGTHQIKERLDAVFAFGQRHNVLAILAIGSVMLNASGGTVSMMRSTG